MYLDVKEMGEYSPFADCDQTLAQQRFADAVSNQAPTVFQNAGELIRNRQPHQPLLGFSQDELARQAKRFRSGFKGVVTYAVKANDHVSVLKTLVAEGIECFDVASIDEMKLVRSINRNARLHYHNPVKSLREISEAYHDYSVRQFALDDVDELQKLNSICVPANTTLLIRFRLEDSKAIHDFSSKFGATPNEAVRLLKLAEEAGFECGLTFHPGSQCFDPVSYATHIKAAAEIAEAAGLRLRHLNVGGGFPATYANSKHPNLEEYFNVINCALNDSFGAHKPTLACEPGRAMVASCMSLLVQVKHVRSATSEIFLQDGIYGALMEYSQIPIMPAIRCWDDAGEPLHGAEKPYHLFGPTCDPLDHLPGTHSLPAPVGPGTYLEFATMGAYSLATATRFNGYGAVNLVSVEEPFML